MTTRVPISNNDFGLFDAELNNYEYEYFFKHIGAFKRFMQEEPKEQRQLFLDAFCDYSYNHIEIKAVATMSDPKKKFIESFRSYAQETFINGKFSAAKQFLNDSVIVARNKHMIQYMDSHSYAKDPFFHKETRDVFRRLFGEPTEAGTCVKVICVLPLYVRFAGSICRYLKRWLDMEESLYPMPVKSGKKSKAEKKALKQQAAMKAALMTSQTSKSEVSKTVPAVQQSTGCVCGSKTTSASGKQGAAESSSSKTVSGGEQSKALVAAHEEKHSQAELDAAEDFSNFCDMHERKQRKRDFRKKGKKHENFVCQHPCHGKVCNCNTHKHNHDHSHGHDHSHCHDHSHGHDPSHEPPQATREELMNCLCTKHKAMAEAKIAEKRAALEKRLQSEGKLSSNGSKALNERSSEVQKTKNSPGKNIAENKGSVAESSENISTESGISVSEGKNFEEKDSVEKTSSDKSLGGGKSQGKTVEVKSSEGDSSEGKSMRIETSLAEKLERESLEEDKSSETDKYSEVGKNSEGFQTPEGDSSEDKTADGKDDINMPSKIEEVRSWEKMQKKVAENGVVSSDDEEYHDCDAAVERFVIRTFPELHLCEPHPNEQYEKMIEEEKKVAKKMKETKLRRCAFCKELETDARTFKKCQKCKGKGTKFYCSRLCQKKDWPRHRSEHE